MLTATFPLKLLLSTRCLLISICGHLILQVSSGSYIYMTFDDGPNEGTPYVLDALKEVQIHPEAFCELLHPFFDEDHHLCIVVGFLGKQITFYT